MTTPADRARALLAKFGPVTEQHPLDDDGYWDGSTTVTGLTVGVYVIDSEARDLNVTVYDWSREDALLLSLHGVRDDDLVEQIVRQVIDHHNGWQVI